MVLTLLTRILVWAAVGLVVWYLLLKFIPRAFLTWFGGAILLTLVVWSFFEPNDEAIGTIWNIISIPLTPLGFSLGLLLFSFKGPPFKEGFKVANGRYVAIALSILLVSSVPLFARTIVSQAEQSVQQAYQAQQGICDDVCPAEIPTDVPLSRVAAVVVLGENMDVVMPPDEFPSSVDSTVGIDPVLNARLDSTSLLYDRLRANGSDPSIIVTSGPVVGDEEERTQDEQLLRQALTSRGVPLETIVVEDAGMDVHRAVRQTRDFLEDRGLLSDERLSQRDSSRIALVAPALAMRRAALTFENEGLQVIAWPTNLYGGSAPTNDDEVLAALSDLVPSAEALRLTTRYWNEVLSSFYYFLRGWLPGFDVRWNEIVELVPQDL